MKKPLAVIVGPTAVGKSNAAVEVASRLNCEIISVDSMQIYKGMNIGTAKILPQEMISGDGKYVPHHLIDIIEPWENFSVATFQARARALIDEIHNRDKLPLLVGGTGLYVQAVIDQYEFSDHEKENELRRQLINRGETLGYEALHDELKAVDEKASDKIHPNDKKRIIRALEYYYSTRKKFSDKVVNKFDSLYKLALIGLTLDRKLLYERINFRVDDMLSSGLVDEVKNLLNQGVSVEATSMQGLGYKQIAEFCLGRLSYDEAVRQLKRDTRRFAKRQLTWFKRDKRIEWLDVDHKNKVLLAEEIADIICRRLELIVE